ncbi:hypothetical protein [Micrococcus sp. TA1]|uniref:hypothetical protein n=1 Tax=Micrococcus sp. TA1 TaxID=681627 RepID=UPI00161C0307|nr:hypothetical protein [Micrococcus sp. TA1]MBB5748565.1 hypothetical protein [Micrococcus sp. TA1]
MNTTDESIKKAKQAWSATCDAGNAGPGYENAWRAALDAAASTIKADAYTLGWQRAVNAHPSWWQDPEYSKNPYRD